jgi:hypothetical protein
MFQHTGLERSAALAADLQYMQQQYKLPPPTVQEDGPGMTYARHLRQLAENDPQSFICHFYNYYFAHTAGGRMIGKKVRWLWQLQLARRRRRAPLGVDAASCYPPVRPTARTGAPCPRTHTRARRWPTCCWTASSCSFTSMPAT